MKAEYIITIDGDPDIMGNYPIKKKQNLIRCKDCMHNESFDTDCPITWNKWDEDFCSYGETLDEKKSLKGKQDEPEINPCSGCEDYEPNGGCKSNGGCADARGEQDG